jgi:hypothetical protein
MKLNVESKNLSLQREYLQALLSKCDHLPAVPDGFDTCFLEQLKMSDMGSLACHLLKPSSHWDSLSHGLQQFIMNSAKRSLVLESQRGPEASRVLQSLARFHPLLFKGTALAYSVYDLPELRARCDTDLLIRLDDRPEIERSMMDLGYSKMNVATGEMVSYQMSFMRIDDVGVEHWFDFHWRVSNPQLFAGMFSYEEFEEEAVLVPRLCPEARRFGDLHSVLISCVHRVAHHFDEENLLWLYDLHLLMKDKDAAWFQALDRLARDKQLANICLRGVELAQFWFGTRVPPDLLDGWQNVDREKATDFLSAKRRWFTDIWLDLKHLGSWRDRFKLLQEHAFPPAQYMLKKYNISNKWLLPAAYVLRGTYGLRKFAGKFRP